jgi:hypothetical protein
MIGLNLCNIFSLMTIRLLDRKIKQNLTISSMELIKINETLFITLIKPVIKKSSICLKLLDTILVKSVM